MSAEYPSSHWTPRHLEDKPGFEYNPDDLTVFFAEDWNDLADEIEAIETAIDTNTAAIATIVDTDLTAIQAELDDHEARITDLEDTVIPALDTRVTDLESEMTQVQGTDIPALQYIQKLIYKEVKTLTYTVPGALPQGVTFAVPGRVGWTPPTPFITLVGGRLKVTHGAANTIYGLICYVERLSTQVFNVFITYRNETTGAVTNTVTLLTGDTVTLDKTITFTADYNPNTFNP